MEVDRGGSKIAGLLPWLRGLPPTAFLLVSSRSQVSHPSISPSLIVSPMPRETLPKRWEPFMREEDLIPPPIKTFPRSAWRNGVFLIPPFENDLPDHDQTRLHWAARNASTEWAESVAMGGHVDRECFLLAVVDKIIEEYVSRSNYLADGSMGYYRQRRLFGFEPRLPTYAEWRQHTNDLIRKWYWIVRAPRRRNLTFPGFPPPTERQPRSALVP